MEARDFRRERDVRIDAIRRHLLVRRDWIGHWFLSCVRVTQLGAIRQVLPKLLHSFYFTLRAEYVVWRIACQHLSNGLNLIRTERVTQHLKMVGRNTLQHLLP